MLDSLQAVWRSPMSLNGVACLTSWMLLAAATYLGARQKRRELAVGLIALAWHLVLLSVACGFISAFDTMSHGPIYASVLEGFLVAGRRATPAILLTFPALWFTLGGTSIRFDSGLWYAVIVPLVAAFDLALFAWAFALVGRGF